MIVFTKADKTIIVFFYLRIYFWIPNLLLFHLISRSLTFHSKHTYHWKIELHFQHQHVILSLIFLRKPAESFSLHSYLFTLSLAYLTVPAITFTTKKLNVFGIFWTENQLEMLATYLTMKTFSH